MEDVTARINKAVSNIENKEFWEWRIDGLRLLQQVFTEDISTLGFEAALSVLNTIRVPLKSQLEDLRSQIVKDACACVAELARNTVANRAVWEHVSDWFLGPLIQLSCNTVTVIAGSAMATLRAISTAGNISRSALGTFITACGHKHNVIRRNAFECVLVLLHTVDVSILQRCMPAINKVIKCGTSDSLQEARRLARLCFWASERVHGDSAVVLYEGLAASAQRALDEEKKFYDQWAAEFGGEARRNQKQPHLDERHATHTSSPLTGGKKAPVSSEVSSEVDSTVVMSPERGGGYGSNEQLSAAAKSPAAISFLTGMPMGSGNDVIANGRSGVEPSKSKGHTALHENVSARNKAKKPARIVARTPRSGGGVTTTRSASSCKHSSGTRPATDGVINNTQQKSSAGTLGRRSASSTKQRGITNGRTPSAADLTSGTSVAPTAPTRTSTAAAPTGTSPYETWEVIKSQASSNDWSARSMAFVELSQLVDLNMLPPEHTHNAVLLSTRHLADIHYRVAVSASGALARLMPKAPQDYFDMLELILALHFSNLSSTKEALRAAATVQLDALLKAFGPSHIQSSLWKVINTAGAITDTVATATLGRNGSGSGAGPVNSSVLSFSNNTSRIGGGGGGSGVGGATTSGARIRLAAVEFLLHVTQTNKASFATISTMRPLLMRLKDLYKRLVSSSSLSPSGAGHTTRTPLATAAGPATPQQIDADCCKATAAVMATLYSASNDTFVEILGAMANPSAAAGVAGVYEGLASGLSALNGEASSSSSAPMSDFRLILKACESIVPHLRQDCQRHATGSKLLRHPEPTVTSPFKRQLEEACSPAAAPTASAKDKRAATTVADARDLAQHGPPSKSYFEDHDTPISIFAAKEGYNLFSNNKSTSNVGTARSLARDDEFRRQRDSVRSSYNINANAFSASQYDPTQVSHTDVGRTLLQNNLHGANGNGTRALPKRAAAALSKLEAVPTPLLVLMEAAAITDEGGSSRYSGDNEEPRISAMRQAIEAITSQPRLWSSRFRDFLSHFLTFSLDNTDSDVRSVALKSLKTIIMTRYLAPLCADHIDDVLRCAVININNAAPNSLTPVGSTESYVLRANELMSMFFNRREERGFGGGGERAGSKAFLSTHADPSTLGTRIGSSNPAHCWTRDRSVSASAISPSATREGGGRDDECSLYTSEAVLGAAITVLEEHSQHNAGTQYRRGTMLLFKMASLCLKDTLTLQPEKRGGGGGGGAVQHAGYGGHNEEGRLSSWQQHAFSMSQTDRADANARGVGGDRDGTENHNGDTAQHGQRTISCTSAAGRALLARFSAILVAAINSSHSEVRKQAVVSVVDLYASIGAPLLPYLVHFSTAQLKLVSIYYNRQCSRAPGGASFAANTASTITMNDDHHRGMTMVKDYGLTPSSVFGSGGNSNGSGSGGYYLGFGSVDLLADMEKHGIRLAESL